MQIFLLIDWDVLIDIFMIIQRNARIRQRTDARVNGEGDNGQLTGARCQGQYYDSTEGIMEYCLLVSH